MIHTLGPEVANLRGAFSRDFPPLLTIAPGDSVRYRTLDAGWGLEPPRLDWSPRRKVDSEEERTESGHCLIGPVAVQGALPGMTLGVHVERVVPGPYGFTFAGGWSHAVNRRLGLSARKRGVMHLWELDAATMRGSNQHGHSVALRPFMGVMGMPPDAPGRHSTVPPRVTGGNLDCKELVAGSTLYLPVAVEGGLFMVGDGHARQGDGEVSVTAIECPMDEVVLTFTLHDDMPLRMPRVHTAEGWFTLGLDAHLQRATFLALEGMVDLMAQEYSLPRADALALASVVVDMRITQIANQVHGVHAFLPHDAIS